MIVPMPGSGSRIDSGMIDRASYIHILHCLSLSVITDGEEQRECQCGDEAVKSGVVDQGLVDIETGHPVNKVLDI